MHILVVDDVAVVRELMSMVAGSAFDGATVHTAENLAGALAMAHTMPSLDLVLLDLGLPDSDGLETLRAFRGAFPRAKVVVVSSNDDDAIVENALGAGAQGFMSKSLKTPAMFAALRTVAGGAVYKPLRL